MKRRFALLLLGALLVARTPATVQADAPTVDAAVAAANNAFAFDLYGRLRDNNKNVFFSPFSTLLALSMTQAGANGATADEMARVLHLPSSAPHDALGHMLTDLSHRDNARLVLADRLFVDQGAHLVPGFSELTSRDYGADVGREDFRHESESARQHVNAWVENQTDKRVRDQMAPGTVGSATRMVLVNSVYFKGTWEQTFNAPNTQPGRFEGASGDSEVAYMRGQKDCMLAAIDGLHILSLPYQGDMSFVVLLPDAPRATGLGHLETSLSAAQWDRWRARLEPARVDLALPRFKDAYTQELSRPLQALGMKLAFGQADFSRMLAGESDLRIDKVQHKAVVDVNETGTVAAAATAVALTRGIEPQVVSLRVDHPFLYAITDERSGAILFLGRFLDPPKAP
jgi:serpin B